jgi:hypothetical protein
MVLRPMMEERFIHHFRGLGHCSRNQLHTQVSYSSFMLKLRTQVAYANQIRDNARNDRYCKGITSMSAPGQMDGRQKSVNHKFPDRDDHDSNPSGINPCGISSCGGNPCGGNPYEENPHGGNPYKEIRMALIKAEVGGLHRQQQQQQQRYDGFLAILRRKLTGQRT